MFNIFESMLEKLVRCVYIKDMQRVIYYVVEMIVDDIRNRINICFSPMSKKSAMSSEIFEKADADVSGFDEGGTGDLELE